MNIKLIILFVLTALIIAVVIELIRMLTGNIGYLIGALLGWSIWVLGRFYEHCNLEQRNKNR